MENINFLIRSIRNALTQERNIRERQEVLDLISEPPITYTHQERIITSIIANEDISNTLRERIITSIIANEEISNTLRDRIITIIIANEEISNTIRLEHNENIPEYEYISNNLRSNQQLPRLVQTRVAEGGEHGACSICWEDMNTANQLVCGHIFHRTCLKSWLETSNTCPLCRYSGL
jgi:hypothetical protein